MIVMPRFPSDDRLAVDHTIAADEEALRQRVLRNPGVRALIVWRFASVLGITPHAVAIRLHRARSRFSVAIARASSDEDLKGLDLSRTSADVKGTHRAGWKGVGE